MNSRPRDLVARCLLPVLAFLFLTAGPGAETVGEAPSSPSACPVASVGGAPVTVADAERLRALLSPPPTSDAARRLAVDSALAWWDLHGSLGDSTPRERLEAWRDWLAGLDPRADPDRLGTLAVARLAAVARRAGLERSPCESRPAPVGGRDGAPPPRSARPGLQSTDGRGKPQRGGDHRIPAGTSGR